MTITEMHQAFKIGYDFIDTQGYPGFEPEEIDFLLNRAIERFVKTRYSGMNIKGLGFEEVQKRIDDLRTLVVRNPLTNRNIGTALDTLAQGRHVYSLPTGLPGSDPKYLFLVSATAFVDKDECGDPATDRRIKIKQVTHDQLQAYLDDPFHQPDYTECLVSYEGNSIMFFTGGLYTITRFDIVYLKHPDVVNLSTLTNCNLPDHTHQEIVDLAVKLAKGNVGDQNGLQIESQLIVEQE